MSTKWKWYVYVIECNDGFYYTGITWDIDKRMEQHRMGKGSKFTAKHGFKELNYTEEFEDLIQARLREKQIKDFSRKKKEYFCIMEESSAINYPNNNIIDGRKLAAKHQELVRNKLSKLQIRPKMVSILIGDDPPSVLYTSMKQKKAQEVGIDFKPIRILASEKFENVESKIKELNEDPKINGIMIQLPIPDEFLKGRSTKEFLNVIDKNKDVDGLTDKGKFLPAVVRAVMEILEDEKVELKDKNAVVLGASKLVGKPIAEELTQKNAIVKICDKHTPNQKEIIKNADVLVCATGVVHLVKGDMVKDGVIVIDVGAEKINDKIVGDVEFKTVAPKASKITPVPGGVGPMTVICLMENVADAVVN